MKFSDSLDRKLEDINRPPALPVGTYSFAIKSVPALDSFTSARTGDEWEKITFNVTCVAPQDDVDEDELADYGSPAGAPMQKVFMFTTDESKKADFERSMFNLKRFLGHAGVDADGMSLSEAFEQAVGGEFLGEVKHRMDPDDPEVVYSELGRTAEM